MSLAGVHLAYRTMASCDREVMARRMSISQLPCLKAQILMCELIPHNKQWSYNAAAFTN